MRNETYEQALNKEGVKWSYVESVPIDDIDTSKSRRNQARLEHPLDMELVNDYKAAMKDGSQFPALVAWRPGKGKWILVDGNHRLAAKIDCKFKTTDLYVIDNTDPLVIDRITWSFNNLVNGRRLSKEESIEHAVVFVRKYGASVKDAAKQYGVDYTTLTRRVRSEQQREVLQRNNIKITQALSDRIVCELSPLLDIGEDLFVKAADVVSTSGATIAEVEDLVRDVRRAKTMQDKIAVVEQFAQSPKMQERKAETKGGTIKVKPSGPREQFAKHTKLILRLLEDYPASTLRAAGVDRKAQMDLLRDLTRKIILEWGLGDVLVDVKTTTDKEVS